MKYWVGCTIKTANTDLMCDIQINDTAVTAAKPYRMDWEEIGMANRLDLGADQGRWFNFKPGGDHKGIVLFPHKQGEESARVYSDAEIIVTMLGVPERFAEKLGCGEYFSGEGTLHRTNELIYWRMWYPCV